MPLPSETNIAWWNGELIAAADARLPVHDLGVVAGASVTEMLRTYQGRPFRITSHLDRFLSSLQTLNFPLPTAWSAQWSTDTAATQQRLADHLEAAVQGIVSHNLANAPSGSELGVILFCTAGANATYLPPGSDLSGTVAVHSFVLPLTRWKSAVEQGVSLRTVTRRQIPGDSLPVEHKVRNRLHWWLADQEAAAVEPGARALLLNHSGEVTETAACCLYMVSGNDVSTPANDVLDSTTRQLVAELCGPAGLTFRSRRITPEELKNADAMFLSSTPCGLLPVSRLDGQPLPDCLQNATFQRLLRAWTDRTGVNTHRQILEAAEQ